MELASMIRREIRILRRTNHLNIIKIYEVFQEEDQVIIVTELLLGGELYNSVK